jgi:hypothetical protein
MSTFGPKSQFCALEQCQSPLILLGLPTAFQADDEGSIPFTRSKKLKDLDVFLGRAASQYWDW